MTMDLQAEPPIRVLLAEDHALVREGLVSLLHWQKIQVVAEAVNGEEAVALYREHRPDITLMDLRMPRMDGVTAIRTIIAEFPEARIIVLTNLDGEEQNCFNAGAQAVVLKDAPKGELVATIREIHAGAS